MQNYGPFPRSPPTSTNRSPARRLELGCQTGSPSPFHEPRSSSSARTNGRARPRSRRAGARRSNSAVYGPHECAKAKEEVSHDPAGRGKSHESSAESLAKRFGDLDKRLTKRGVGPGNHHRHTT